MGFLNKLKNIFFEEEEIEVEEKPKKEKPIAKKVELPKKEKKRMNEEVETQEEKEFEEVEVASGETYTPKEKENAFKFPVLLEDDLIEEEIEVEEKPKRRVVEEEPPKRSTMQETIEDRDLPSNNSYTRDLNAADYSLDDHKAPTKGFKPSPIISPIYGVLDKNYKKDDIHDKKETHPTSFSFSNDKIDLDSVRRKAFGGDIATDIEKDIEEDIVEDTSTDYEDDGDLDMTDTNMTPVVDKVTVGDAEEYFTDLGLEYNIDYKDSSKEKASGKRVSRTKKNEEYEHDSKDATVEEVTEVETGMKTKEETNNEEPVVEEKKRTRSKKTDDKEESKEDVEIEDNLFDLIDSMYDEGE